MLIAHLSDLHVCASAPRSAANIYTQQAVASLMRLPMRPDLAVVTGDIGEGSPDDYDLLASYLEPLSMPVYMVPGNHDDREVMRSALMPYGYMPASGPLNFLIETRPIRVIGLEVSFPAASKGLSPMRRSTFLRTLWRQSLLSLP